MNRRQALAGIGFAGVVAVTPLIGASIAKAAVADTGKWDAAHARYDAARRAYDLVCDRHDRAEEAAGEAQPRVARYFDEYQLGMSMKRDDVEFWLARYATRTGKRIDIQKTADKFAAYQRRSAEIGRSFQIEALWADVRDGLPIYLEAREGLMNVPAPHQAALLVKIEVAAESLDNRHGEIVLADARRLLGGEA